jgi:hypothetical protein
VTEATKRATPRDGNDRPTRLLTLGGLLVTLIACTVGVLFKLDPRLAPCLGTSSATFAGVPVFPHIRYRQFLADTGLSSATAASARDLPGAEIRYSYETHSLPGRQLVLRYSLLTVDSDGTLGAFVSAENLSPGLRIAPTACSQTAGNTLFVQIPDPHRRYEVVLELYVGEDLTDRVALAQTAIFHG